jgi:cyanophycinase-like exopeptidase
MPGHTALIVSDAGPTAREDGGLMGTLVLAGSGEFLPTMRAVDAIVLTHLSRATRRIAIVPTASGREGRVPFDWIARGIAHFAALDCEAFGVPILERADADLPEHVAALAGADLIYLSGGDPRHLIETLRGSAAWAAIRTAYAGGAILAGSSAGAMALGELVTSPRAATPAWQPALGLVPGIGVLPHYDRFGGARTAPLVAAAPPRLIVLGIDEDTVILTVGGESRVLGARGVTLLRDGTTTVFSAGERLPYTLAPLQSAS